MTMAEPRTSLVDQAPADSDEPHERERKHAAGQAVMQRNGKVRVVSLAKAERLQNNPRHGVSKAPPKHHCPVCHKAGNFKNCFRAGHFVACRTHPNSYHAPWICCVRCRNESRREASLGSSGGGGPDSGGDGEEAGTPASGFGEEQQQQQHQ